MLALTGADWVDIVTTIAVAAAAIGSLVVATIALRQGNRALRRSTQPIVIVHEVSSDISTRGEGIDYRVFLQNHGEGTAFNVRFGVEINGVRYPYRFGSGIDRGARQLVETGARLPHDDETLLLRTDWAPYLEGEGEGGAKRIFWARYENAFGETWQTTNPHDPTEDTVIEPLGVNEAQRRERQENERRRELEERMEAGEATLTADVE